MAVYIDDMFASLGRMKMCHMIADTDEELHKMAFAIGMRKEWWQSPEKTYASHYDVASGKRLKAIELGAIAITSRQAVALVNRKKVTGKMGSPEDALDWYYNYLDEKKKLKSNS